MPDAPGASAGWLAKRWRALRAFSFPLSAAPVVVATAAVLPPSEWDWGILAASVLGVVLLHAAGNLLNDYFDFLSGVDRKLDGDESRPGRLLVRGELAAGDVLGEAVFCLVLAACAGGYLLARTGPGILWFGLPAAAALYAYTGPPFRLKYRAAGEVVIFIFFGPLLMAGAAWAQVGALPLPVLLLAVPVGLVTTGVLLGNNLRDTEEDASAGVKTLAHLMGSSGLKAAYALSIMLPVAAVGGLVAAGLVARGALVGLIAAVPAAFLLRRVLAAERLPDIDVRTARYALIFMLALGVGLVI
jgi:1,4-dihydroxy-2-naphthoate octaprenyltransferase